MGQPSPRRKRRRLSHDEARSALIEAGKRLLVERGLDTGLGLVTLNAAIVASGVPRASAYRVFERDDVDPQVAFRTELLISYIEGDPLAKRREAAQLIADDTLIALQTDDPVELARALREAIRLAFAGTVTDMTKDPDWQIIGPSWAATALNPWAPEELVQAHRKADLSSVRNFVPLYQLACAAGGMKLRPELDWATFALLANSTANAASFYSRYHPELRSIMRPTGPNGEEQPWSHEAVLIEGLALTSFVPDPDAEVSADLSVWTRP
ncbi:MAG: hypothetical protein AAGA93_10485 [Actinomycetota bacterium]